MSTRSTISLEFADGTVGQVYCHFDGYLENNGKLLQNYYTDPFKVRELIDLGDLSCLAPEIGQKHSFDGRDNVNWCMFYGRDRGETGVDARYFKDFEDYKANHQYQEYEYILRTDGQWYVSDHGSEYKLLAEELVAEALV